MCFPWKGALYRNSFLPAAFAGRDHGIPSGSCWLMRLPIPVTFDSVQSRDFSCALGLPTFQVSSRISGVIFPGCR